MVDPAVRDISPLQAIGIGNWIPLCRLVHLRRAVQVTFTGKKELVCSNRLHDRGLTGLALVPLPERTSSLYAHRRAAGHHHGRQCLLRDHSCPESAGSRGASRTNTRPTLGKFAGLRSLHNNYITLPVIYVMISNHFPVTYGGAWNWAILAGLTLGSVAVRHYINLHEKESMQPACYHLPPSPYSR